MLFGMNNGGNTTFLLHSHHFCVVRLPNSATSGAKKLLLAKSHQEMDGSMVRLGKFLIFHTKSLRKWRTSNEKLVRVRRNLLIRTSWDSFRGKGTCILPSKLESRTHSGKPDSKSGKQGFVTPNPPSDLGPYAWYSRPYSESWRHDQAS